MNSISYIAQTVDRALNNDATNPSQIIPRENSEIIHNQRQKPVSIKEPSDHEISIVSKRNNQHNNNIKTKVQKIQQNYNDQKQSQSKISFIIHIILFIPNLIIIRPLLFTWFILTFPLNLLESRKSNEDEEENDDEYLKNKTNPNSNEFEDYNYNSDDENKNSNNHPNSDSEPPSITPSLILSPLNPQSQSQSQTRNSTIPEIDEETESLTSSPITQPIDLKSPTSPTSSALSHLNSKYLSFPKFVFPRNLINSNQKKTLILDLDETLVHSLSRGTRMNNGNMIEVKLNNQVATLYYVYKRPYCDHFLKQISKWFNLVIFTASVKEYADPVIDWLESERKYFTKRYYRDHCTLRDGQGYIKDLSIVDKNLQNLIIIDNSPISYAWHESNAIIVEGWINDPSDSDLLNLIPLLNGLRYTTDVRSILGLKNGEVALEK